MSSTKQQGTKNIQTKTVESEVADLVGSSDIQSQQKLDATYHLAEWEPEEYRDNPFILALPPYHNRTKTIQSMNATFAVPHHDSARKLPDYAKLLCVKRVLRNFIPLPVHVQIFDWVHSQLRAHYHSLVESRDAVRVRSAYADVQAGTPGMVTPLANSHSQVLFVFGMSGVGKTTSSNMGLSGFPHIILHREFNGKPFRQSQVIRVHVTCPHNGSVTSVCKEILEWFDINLGTDYLREMKKRGVNSADYVDKVGRVLLRHNVGLLVIDEMQNALRAADSREMLDMLVNLLNWNACAVLAIGTPEAEKIIAKRFRLARRIGSQVVRLRPFEIFPEERLVQSASSPDGRKSFDTQISPEVRGLIEDRDKYVDSLTRIDFLPKKFQDTVGVRNALMTCSAGVPAFLNVAWMLTQYAGITTGAEMVTPRLVETATREAFGLVEGLLNALRRKDYVVLDRVGDMAMGRLMSHLESVVTQSERDAVNATQQENAQIENFARTATTLIDLGYGEAQAELVITEIQRDAPGLDAPETLRRALDRLKAPDFNASVSPGKAGRSSQGSAASRAPNPAPGAEASRASSATHKPPPRSRDKHDSRPQAKLSQKLVIEKRTSASNTPSDETERKLHPSSAK
jgi:hypothetical protein